MSTTKKTIIVNCFDLIGESMAGPAIRSWEFAHQLSKKHNVVVFSPFDSEKTSKDFKLLKFTEREFARQMQQADFLISQKIGPKIAKTAKKYKVKIIIDAYDPVSLEALESVSAEDMFVRKSLNKVLLMEQSISLMYADSVICASEKQRDLWLGALSTLKKITPEIYDNDNSLRNLIDVVPFGLSQKKPLKTSSDGLRSKFGFSQKDFVILWGGGIWNWFDPLTLIKAIEVIKDTVPIKLVFMGIDHPNPNIPRMPMVKSAEQLSKKLKLTNKQVYFNSGWVPYDSRQQFLLDANVGVSTHYDHLETRFSFRTRMLDYIWAGLPILATKGDSFAELIEEKSLGIVVDYKDKNAIAEAISELYSNKKLYDSFVKNILDTQKDFYWDKCIDPIENMIEYWYDKPSEKLVSVSSAVIGLTTLYGGHVKQALRYLKKYFGVKENMIRVGKVYRSQNIIRRQRFIKPDSKKN